MSAPGRALLTLSELTALLAGVRTAAVIGAKPLDGAAAASFVPAAMLQHGWRVLPVGPAGGPAGGYSAPFVRSLDEISEPVDLVVVFRRSEAVASHCDEVLRLRPRAVWLQLGVRDPGSAARWCAAGIDVVQDRCVKVDLGLL